MRFEILDDPSAELVSWLEQKIDDYNWRHWEVKQRLPLAVTVSDEQGSIIAGAAARTFGRWLLLDTLWVSPEHRGMDLGSQLLAQLEARARERGCIEVLLDTLDFQAQPFYLRHGYQVVWTQNAYPQTGCKYFMTKQL